MASEAGPGASVIIPVRNAAETLPDTLRSLADQSFSDFEVIIVDDGSSDETAAIVQSWMGRDPRIRLLPQPPSGVSAARNNGLKAARAPWILFLDGDDWITPDFFTRMLDTARDHPEADIIYCGYRRIPVDGADLPVGFEPQLEINAMRFLAVNCEVCVHSLLVRRDLILEAGGFDTSLKTSEDWDLWIRFARMGAQFVAVHRVMALYRVRPGSASSKALQMAKDYQTVVRRAHEPDPRVKRGPERYAQGWRGTNLDRLCLEKTAYIAASEAAHGGHGVVAFDTLEAPLDCASLIPELSRAIFYGLTIGAGIAASALRNDVEPYVREIAARIEKMSSGPPVAQQIMHDVTALIIDAQDLSTPKTLWGMHARTFELGAPSFDLVIPDNVHHLLLKLHHKGHVIDTYSLPVGGPMTAPALEELFLRGLGFALPKKRHRILRALALGPRLSIMTAKMASKIWRSRWDRKRKYTSLVRNIHRIFLLCAMRTLATPRAVATRIADRDVAAQLIERYRAEILGDDAPQIDEYAASSGRTHSKAPRRVPVLMYHRIAEDGPKALAEWRVSAASFEEQLKFLKREGFTTITSCELGAAMRGERSLPARPVMLTFDDAYCDFHARAFPLLQRYGATAELFVVTGKVGTAADWDRAFGPPAPLMGWAEIDELDRAGIVIGSHMASHFHASRLDDETLIREGAASRFMLEARLGHPVTSLALPFGDYDDRVIEAMSLCGYRHIYTCDSEMASSGGDPLRIPRLNVAGDTDILSFARMLGSAPAKETAFA